VTMRKKERHASRLRHRQKVAVVAVAEVVEGIQAVDLVQVHPAGEQQDPAVAGDNSTTRPILCY
jgi:hypothetical protein